MFLHVLGLVTIFGCLQVQSYVPVPASYKKIYAALDRYSSNPTHNPIIYSLLTVLVYDKRSKAFITDDALELALEDVKRINVNDERILRKFFSSSKSQWKNEKVPAELSENIETALDIFFSKANTDDNDTLELLAKQKNSKNGRIKEIDS